MSERPQGRESERGQSGPAEGQERGATSHARPFRFGVQLSRADTGAEWAELARKAEALDVLDGLFGPGPFSSQGKHYQLNGLGGLPKPIQQPRPPLLIGGGGRRGGTPGPQRARTRGGNPPDPSGPAGPG